MRIASAMAAIAIVSSAMIFASSAAAAIVEFRFTGNVLSGRDYSNAFGFGGSLVTGAYDLTGAGRTFDAVIAFDTTVSRLNPTMAIGGNQEGTPTPALFETVSTDVGTLQQPNGSDLTR